MWQLEDYTDEWVMKTALLFTIIMIMNLALGGDVSRISIIMILIEAGVLTAIGIVVWEIRKLQRNLKWMIHYMTCFMAHIFINIISYQELLTRWHVKDWLIHLFWYTVIYSILSYRIMARNKREVLRLNQNLEAFKKRNNIKD